MLMQFSLRHLIATAALITISATGAAEDAAHDRQKLMEGVRDAAKPVGAMLRGDKDFDADTVQSSLAVFADAANRLGDLVPEGSEGGEAAPAIWEDPDGFAAAIKEWQDVTAAAIEAAPQSVDEAKPSIGPVFGACKNCHDGYRIEKD